METPWCTWMKHHLPVLKCEYSLNCTGALCNTNKSRKFKPPSRLQVPKTVEIFSHITRLQLPKKKQHYKLLTSKRWCFIGNVSLFTTWSFSQKLLFLHNSKELRNQPCNFMKQLKTIQILVWRNHTRNLDLPLLRKYCFLLCFTAIIDPEELFFTMPNHSPKITPPTNASTFTLGEVNFPFIYCFSARLWHGF